MTKTYLCMYFLSISYIRICHEGMVCECTFSFKKNSYWKLTVTSLISRSSFARWSLTILDHSSMKNHFPALLLLLFYLCHSFLQKANNIFWASVVTLEIWLVVVAAVAVTPNVKSIQTFLGWIPCCEIIHYAHPSSFCCAISHGWPLCIGLCMFLLLLTIFTPGLVRVHTIKYSLYTRGSIWNSVIAKEKEFFCFAQRA